MNCMSPDFRLLHYRIYPFETFELSAHVSGVIGWVLGGLYTDRQRLDKGAAVGRRPAVVIMVSAGLLASLAAVLVTLEGVSPLSVKVRRPDDPTWPGVTRPDLAWRRPAPANLKWPQPQLRPLVEMWIWSEAWRGDLERKRWQIEDNEW